MDNMDLHEYSAYFQIPQTLEGIRVSNVIELPREIQYFTEQDGNKNLALEISKGTSILWLPSKQLNDIYIGYGLRSYPTYDKGWRYVKPFMLSGQNTDIEQLPYYFVRTKDLEAVAKEAIRSTKYLMKTMQNRGMSMEDAIFIYTRFIDNIFYDKGVFCSPDLLRQVWHWIDTVLLCLSAGLRFVAWLLRRTFYSSKLPFYIEVFASIKGMKIIFERRKGGKEMNEHGVHIRSPRNIRGSRIFQYNSYPRATTAFTYTFLVVDQDITAY